MGQIAIATGCSIQKAQDQTYQKEDDIVEWTINFQQLQVINSAFGLSYSFLNFSATLAAPGFLIEMGNGAAPADAGITLAYEGEHSRVRTGADGSAITATYQAKNGTATIRLLKNSPAVPLLSALLNVQKINPDTVAAQGVLTVRYVG